MLADAYVQQMLNLTWLVDESSARKYPISFSKHIKLNDMSITGSSYDYCSGAYPMLRGYG